GITDTHGRSLPLPAALTIFAAPVTTASSGSRVPITIMDFAFRPGSITVHVGDTVVWTNNGPSPHTSTSDAGPEGEVHDRDRHPRSEEHKSELQSLAHLVCRL